MYESEEDTDKFWDKAEAILPGKVLGFIKIEAITYVLSILTLISAEENSEGNYNIYGVETPNEDFSIEPEYYLLETVNRTEIITWLKNKGFDEDIFDN